MGWPEWWWRHKKPAATQVTGQFATYFSYLQKLSQDPSLWVDGAEPPSQQALTLAQAFMQQLEKDHFPPTGVVASGEGGAGIYFIDGNKYADLECLNSGAILGVISNRRDRPTAYEVEQDAGGLAHASLRIREWMTRS